MIEEMRARFDLAGKKAIVTGVGAMEGIGRYLAEGLCEAGAEVVLINRSERMFTVRDYLREKGYAVHGVIADLEVKEYNQSSAYKEVCSVIDDATMEIVFNVLETEIAHLKAGMEVEITPYANDKVTLKGTVTEVNPKIDENGMVKVRATTDNPEAVLVDGMNVSILAKRQIADKLIVPKTAVLPRQGRKVVFVYENGRAIWKYVETGFENSREVCIESGLKEGEEAIYENNLGLSHECEVTLINKKE